MLVKVFNLRMNLDSMQYDDSVLTQFASEHDVVSMKTQFFYFREEPIWSVIVSYRKQYTSTALQQSVRMNMSYRNLHENDVESGAVTPLNHQAFEALRIWRNETARQLGHPPSNVFNNQQLKEIVQLHPTSIHQLTKVTGIGQYKSSTYGHEILAILKQYMVVGIPAEVQVASGEEPLSDQGVMEISREAVRLENPLNQGKRMQDDLNG